MLEQIMDRSQRTLKELNAAIRELLDEHNHQLLQREAISPVAEVPAV